MMFAVLGLTVSAAFAGAAFYINWSEQPSRLRLDDPSLLRAWKPSYVRGFAMQAPLALAAGILGGLSYWVEGSTAAAVGGALMIANWPFTLLCIMPTNTRLCATPETDADAQARRLVIRWGRLHAVRTTLALAGAAAFVVALTA